MAHTTRPPDLVCQKCQSKDEQIKFKDGEINCIWDK